MRPLTEYTVQRLRGRFAMVWKEGDQRHRRQLYSMDRQSAEAEARQLWKNADDAPWNVGRAVTGYIDDLAKDNPPSLQRRRDAWKAMSLFWNGIDPALIDEDMCRAYSAKRKVSDATVRYELLLLSTALKWAKDKIGLTERPVLWLPPKPDRQIRHLSKEEFEVFFSAVHAAHAKLYALLGLYTMARPSAILALVWDQIDFRLGQIDLNPPGRRQTVKKRPVVAMNDVVSDLLQQAYQARQIDHVIERGGQPLACIKKAFQAASLRCGFRVTPYILRHTGAVWAAEAGVSMSELAQFMGHDDDRTTQKHYARYSPTYLKKVANSVRRLGEPDP